MLCRLFDYINGFIFGSVLFDINAANSSASFLLQIREQLLKLSAKENHIFT